MNNNETKPLLVHYPHGGKMFLMNWWTYMDRGHVVLARSERAIKEVALRVFKEHSDAEIREYAEVDLVAPPNRLIELASKYDYQEKIDRFIIEITHRLKEVLEAGGKLPASFALCDKYQSPEDIGFVTAEENKWKFDTHYDCTNCHERIVFGMTHEELYKKYGQQWRALTESKLSHLKKKQPRPDKRCLSRAPQANDDEQLWCAVANFGHHSTGIDLEQVDQGVPEELGMRPRYLSSSALFFYRKLRGDLDQTLLQAILSEEKLKFASKRKRDEVSWKNKREQETKDRINEVIQFFGGK